MGALPNSLPKKQPRSAVRPPLPETQSKGFFPYQHAWTRQLRRICLNWTEDTLVREIMSQANQRNFAGSPGAIDGWTAPLQSSYLAELCYVSERMVNLALEALAERGVIEQRSIKQALKKGLISKDERPADRFGSVCRVRIQAWPELVKQAELARAAEAKADQDNGKCISDDEPKVLKVTDGPMVLLPGAKSKPMVLSDAVRRRIARCTSVESDLAGKVSASMELFIDGDILRLNLVTMDAPGPVSVPVVSRAETGPNGKCISDDANKRDTVVKQLVSYLNPSFVGLFGKSLDLPLAGRIADALGDCPVDVDDGYCFARFIQKRLQQKDNIKPVFFVSFAKEARDTWQQMRPRPAAPSKVRTLDEILADRRKAKAQ